VSDPICSACGQPCSVITRDWGIGEEVNGVKATHPGLTALSACCKAGYTLGDPMVDIAREFQETALREGVAQRRVGA